ncbi:hypothetical protein CWM47_34065 [Spirosoma pollinicola]|uniref:Ricin B lectin domain-containing protein n=1 Tax=Spirosoma pollinicola TaxID=2057025 RepID=A0A2K8Z972_9BACT|nr:hypothetical protein CWM47_34065 [Spirosoma pollinicola]
MNLSVPTPQTSNGVAYEFTGWSSGLGASLTVPSASATYTANFTASGSQSTSPVVSGALYTIIAKHSGKALELYNGSRDDGGRIVQWSVNGGDNQKWLFTNLNNGYYSIKSVSSGKLLDVYGVSMDNGASVLQWSSNGQYNQQFKLVDVGGGYFNIVARHSNKVFDIAGISQADGPRLQQWSNSGGDNQKFRFSRLSGGRSGASQESGVEVSVVVYPNPAADLVRVSGTGGGEVRVVDVLGRLQTRAQSVGDGAELDISALAPGVYLVQLHKDEQLISRKLIINH